MWDRALPFVQQQFSNRELAIIFWMLLLLTWSLRNERSRKSLGSVLRAAVHWKVLSVLACMFAYVASMTVGLRLLGIWNALDHLKDTLVWAATVAMVMLFGINDARKDTGFFRETIKDALKATVVLEFVIGLYPFRLFVEMLLVPFTAMLGAALAITETKQDYRSARRLIQSLLALVGIAIIGHSVSGLLNDVETFAHVDPLIALALPSILTLGFLPFVFVFALVFEYELLLVRLRFQNKNASIVRYAMWRIFVCFGLRLGKLTTWARSNIVLRFDSKEDVRRALRE